LILAVSNVITFIRMLDIKFFQDLRPFATGVVIGTVAATFFIRGHLAVLTHELKHAVTANLFGNKWKGLKVYKNSGLFEYEYTKTTAGYNAFITLAPYWLPLFTFPVVALTYLFVYTKGLSFPIQALLVGAAFGADLRLGLGDIWPGQSDLTSIRGGYRIGLLYVYTLNVVTITFLFAWGARRGEGLLELIAGLALTLETLLGL
jgi:hypothetical protein